jgi:class 3 adenylate cyclase
MAYADTPLEQRLYGTRRHRILLEFFGNTAHFPIANIFLELLLEGPQVYFSEVDVYILIFACIVQAIVLGSLQHNPRPYRLLGNLIAPALYTVVELTLDANLNFFYEPNHVAYWSFALLVGGMQTLQLYVSALVAKYLLIIESLIRASILLVMYWIFSHLSDGSYPTLQAFFVDDSHLFLTVTTLLIGFMLGMARFGEAVSIMLLRETSEQLKCYSEWLLGKNILAKAVQDPSQLSLARRERTVLFMDIRGFTHWSESQAPEQVVSMLNAYCETAEQCWQKSDAIKVKLTGDEIMIVFQSATSAYQTAQELTDCISQLLSRYQLGAGIGLHSGPLVEGLLGSQNFKTYDVIGDTVNTAKRICDQAHSGELLVSEQVLKQLSISQSVQRWINAKGKTEPLAVFAVS